MASAPAGTRVVIDHHVNNINNNNNPPTEEDQMRMISLLVNLRQGNVQHDDRTSTTSSSAVTTAKAIPTATNSATSHNAYGMGHVPISAWNNHCEEVEILCRHDRDLNVVNQSGHTALFTAVWNGCIGCVEKLVKAGADCNIVDRYDNSPLILAAELAYVQVTERLLLARVPINHRNYKGETALNKAASTPYVPCVRLLLKHGADPNIPDNTNCTPLFRCINRNTLPSAFDNIVLLIKSNAQLEMKGRDHETEAKRSISPLELAVRLGRHSAVRLLVLGGCNLSLMRKWIDDDLVPESLRKDICLFNYLKETSSCPPQLRQTCRKVIRRHCTPNKLHLLLLPRTLIDYISFKELEFA